VITLPDVVAVQHTAIRSGDLVLLGEEAVRTTPLGALDARYSHPSLLAHRRVASSCCATSSASAPWHLDPAGFPRDLGGIEDHFERVSIGATLLRGGTLTVVAGLV
jgi:hypothetical protein